MVDLEKKKKGRKEKKKGGGLIWGFSVVIKREKKGSMDGRISQGLKIWRMIIFVFLNRYMDLESIKLSFVFSLCILISAHISTPFFPFSFSPPSYILFIRIKPNIVSKTHETTNSPQKTIKHQRNKPQVKSQSSAHSFS